MKTMKRYEHNFDRYKTVRSQAYDTKGLTYYLLRYPADRILIPLVKRVHGQRVIDVGCGTGYYSVRFPRSNTVIGVDINPRLAAHSGLKIVEARAEDFAQKLSSDINPGTVFSAWMTEYLDAAGLVSFFQNSYTILPRGGTFMSTVIGTGGFGFVYVLLAWYISGVRKYSHAPSSAIRALEATGFRNITVIHLRSWARIPFGYIVSAQKL